MARHDAFRYDFTFRELMYFLFHDKTCPKCGHPMEQMKTYETVNGSQFGSHSVVHHDKQVKHYLYLYHCRECGARYTLSELAEKGELK